jgi:hypothetical protein
MNVSKNQRHYAECRFTQCHGANNTPAFYRACFYHVVFNSFHERTLAGSSLKRLLAHWPSQGILTKGEGSVRLTSFHLLF